MLAVIGASPREIALFHKGAKRNDAATWKKWHDECHSISLQNLAQAFSHHEHYHWEDVQAFLRTGPVVLAEIGRKQEVDSSELVTC